MQLWGPEYLQREQHFYGSWFQESADGWKPQMDMDNTHFIFICVGKSADQYLSSAFLSTLDEKRLIYLNTPLFWMYCEDWTLPFPDTRNKIWMNITWHFIWNKLYFNYNSVVCFTLCAYAFFSETQNIN